MDRINGRAIVPFILLCAPLVAGAQSAPARKDIPAIAKASSGAIVSIIIGNKEGPIVQGTGFFINKNGAILTNYHVIRNGDRAVAELQDGRTVTIDGVLAFNKTRDVAIVKAHGDNFRTLTLGNSDQLEVGDEVVAIGSPQGLESTVSNGIVSAIRTVEGKGKLLQISVPISHGSSGGPLFNMAGEVVGITSSGIEEGENLNFAIPINDAKKLLLSPQKLTALPNEPMPDEEAPKDSKEVKPEEIQPKPGAAPHPTEQEYCNKEANDFLHQYLDLYSTVKSSYPPNHKGAWCYVAMVLNDGVHGDEIVIANVDMETAVLPHFNRFWQGEFSERTCLIRPEYGNTEILSCDSLDSFARLTLQYFGIDVKNGPSTPVR